MLSTAPAGFGEKFTGLLTARSFTQRRQSDCISYRNVIWLITMKILVATKQTQGTRKNDFCFVPEDEIVIFSVECASDGGNPDGACGCLRSMCGISCRKATTTMKVVDLPGMTVTQFGSMLRKFYEEAFKINIGDAEAQEDARELQKIAIAHRIGTILEKRGSTEDVSDPVKIFHVRRTRS